MIDQELILRNAYTILPESRYKGFKPQKYDLNILTVSEKIQYGLAQSWQYCCQINSSFARTHVLTDIYLQKLDRKSSPIISADLDPVEHKYILVGKSSGGLAIYNSDTVNKFYFSQIAVKRGGSRGTHKNGVTCVQWYPMDAGLFTTSSSDNMVKVWDPNSMQNVDDFHLGCKVYHHHMSPVASKHSLLAAAGETGEVILCDLRSGSSTHRMHGHEGPVQVVQWTRHNQNCLASGGKDKTIRLWDVRSGKSCLKILGESSLNTSSRKDKRKNANTAHSSAITSLCFSHDGLWLVSFSYDGQIKVWNTSTSENRNIRFGTTFTLFRRAFNMAITSNLYPDLVYIPSKSKICVYEITTGTLVNVLDGHFDTVLGTIFNPKTGDMYSYGADRNFLVWTPERFIPKDLSDDESLKNNSSNLAIKDSWSSDEG